MKIVKDAGAVDLQFKQKIIVKKKKYERKNGFGESLFYQAHLPEAVREYLDINGVMYFTGINGEILISKEAITENSVGIKLHETNRNNQFSLPKRLFNDINSYTFVCLNCK